MKRSAPFDTAFGPSKITPRPEWAECLLRGSFGTAFGPILGTLIGSRFRPHSTPHSTHGGEGAGIFKRLPPDPRDPAASVLRTGFSKVKSNRDVPTMANEEWTKRFLRLACYSPKDTREPRGPEHMAKMKAARGPYSDPRDTYIARTIR